MSPAIEAHADSLTKVPAASVQSFYGSSFPASYSVGGNSYTTTFTYFNTLSNLECDGVEIDDNPVASSVLQFRNYDLVLYAAEVSQSQGRVDSMTVSGIETYFSDTVRGGVFVSCYLDRIISNDNSIISYPNNYFGSFQAICGDTQASSTLADYYGYVDITAYSGWSAMDFRFIPFYSDDAVLYLDSMEFENLLTYMPSGVRTVYLGFLTPYIGGSMTGSPPQSSTSDTSGSSSVTTVNVNVTVDMDQTNGLLSQIKQGIDGLAAAILNGLKDLFIPDEDFMEEFKDDLLGNEDENIEGFLPEHLGGLYESIEIIDEFVEDFPDVVAKQSITVPAANIPLAGETFTFGGWEVPLKVDGLPSILYESIAWITDFLCTVAFLRMCRNKLEIFLNPDSEVIHS